MGKKDKYNSSGYLDMTAYLALRKIERDARRARLRKDKEKKDANNFQDLSRYFQFPFRNNAYRLFHNCGKRWHY